MLNQQVMMLLTVKNLELIVKIQILKCKKQELTENKVILKMIVQNYHQFPGLAAIINNSII
jgi:hypothetical protein